MAARNPPPVRCLEDNPGEQPGENDSRCFWLRSEAAASVIGEFPRVTWPRSRIAAIICLHLLEVPGASGFWSISTCSASVPRYFGQTQGSPGPSRHGWGSRSAIVLKERVVAARRTAGDQLETERTQAGDRRHGPERGSPWHGRPPCCSRGPTSRASGATSRQPRARHPRR